MRTLGHELTLHKLEVLCLVAELESVSAAAEQLRIAQPVVTAHLRSIEDKLGVKVTYRAGRRIAFTEDGERVVLWARDILNRTRELGRELADSRLGLQGSAVLATSMSVGSYRLPELLVAFRNDNPRAEIAVTMATPRRVTQSVLSGEADFGLTILDESIDLTGLDADAVATDELVLVGAPGSSTAYAAMGPALFWDAPFVTSARGSSRRRIEDSVVQKLGYERGNIFLELGHAEAMLRTVKTGVGIAFLFRSSVADELQRGDVEQIKIDGLNGAVPIHLLRRKTKRFSPFQQNFIAFLRQAMAADDS